MTTLVRVYRDLMAERESPPSPALAEFLDESKKLAAWMEDKLAEAVEEKITDIRAEAERTVKEANDERQKFIHMRTLLHERADKAADFVSVLSLRRP